MLRCDWCGAKEEEEYAFIMANPVGTDQFVLCRRCLRLLVQAINDAWDELSEKLETKWKDSDQRGDS